VFTKMIFPTATLYFLENRPAPMLGNISHGGAKRINDRTWLAIGLVLCAHMALFAALLPQSQSLPVETMPEPIMVSLISSPLTAPQKPTLPATPIEKTQKPIKKQVKKPVTKPVAPAIKPTSLPITPPVEQTAMPATPTSAPDAEPEAKPTNNKAADTQAYQSPSFNAAYLNNPAPNYPSISRRLGEQGLVLLRVQVTVDGTAGSVELQTGSGSSRLDQAALEAVKKWQFVPAKRGEQSVSASVVVPVRFSIEG
jgi:protein TonB